MELRFKIATREDVAEIIQLCNECFSENTSVEKALRCFEQTEQDPNQIYLVGYLDEKMIAHTKITIVPTMFDGMDTYAVLNHVCVKPEYRKHKIATFMLEEVSRICKEHDCISLKLWSNNYRVPAHECYKKYGFEVNDASFFSKKLD